MLLCYAKFKVSTTSPASKLMKLKQKKQDGQCKYNITLRRVRVSTVAMEKQYVTRIPSMCL
jgi:hypothetical protein